MTDGTESKDARAGRTLEGEIDPVQDGEFWYDWTFIPELGTKFRRTKASYVVEDHWMPVGLQLLTKEQEPQIYFEVEVGPGGPRLTEFAFISRDPDSRGIRQSDFRGVQVSALVEDLVASLTFRLERDEQGAVSGSTVSRDDEVAIRRFVTARRDARTSRDITPQLLERVAQVYRENIDGHPTKAVQHHFQVSQRMAAEYVSRARKRGLLPPTKKGKKKA